MNRYNNLNGPNDLNQYEEMVIVERILKGQRTPEVNRYQQDRHTFIGTVLAFTDSRTISSDYDILMFGISANITQPTLNAYWNLEINDANRRLFSDDLLLKNAFLQNNNAFYTSGRLYKFEIPLFISRASTVTATTQTKAVGSNGDVEVTWHCAKIFNPEDLAGVMKWIKEYV